MDGIHHMQTVDFDPTTGEARLLLCRTSDKVLILDSELLQVTELAHFKDCYIGKVYANVVDDSLMITIWYYKRSGRESPIVKFIRYQPPSKV